MASVACRTGVLVISYPLMILCQFRWVVMFMTINTAKDLEVSRGSVAFDALIPFVFMFPAVNWKVHIIVIKRGWIPGGFIMADGAIGGELTALVIG